MNRFLSIICLGCLLLMLGGCAHPAPVPVAAASPTQRLCPRHHVALITVRGYTLSRQISCALPTEKFFRLQKYYPCATTTFQSFERSEDYPDPALITYCPQCEAAMNRLLR